MVRRWDSSRFCSGLACGEIETAAIIKVELLVLMQHGLGIERRAEIEPALRHAADNARFGGEREIAQHALFGARRQFERAAPRDDLALVERQWRNAIERHALAP